VTARSKAGSVAWVARQRAAHARDLVRVAVPGTVAWTRDRLARSAYRKLDEAALRATRRSETCFVFGSGRSLLEISPEEWARIGEHDVVSLREFPRQHWIRADYHITGEVDFLDEYAARIVANPLYAETVFVVQQGWLAETGNNLVGRRLLPAGARIFRYRRTARGRYAPPSRQFSQGLVHGFNSSISATNFAVLMGWRRIVLCGIDLYDKGYFWLDEGETRSYEKPGIAVDSLFTNAPDIVTTLGRWRDVLEPEGIELMVYNPRSLLARVLPVFDRSAA
jgi:hypothetical protein